MIVVRMYAWLEKNQANIPLLGRRFCDTNHCRAAGDV